MTRKRRRSLPSGPQNTRTVEIESFIAAGQIDARYFEKPYYIVPREEIGEESFAVIRDAMNREGLIGLARIVLSSRERPFLVEPMDAGLRGVTLRFSPHEVRGAEDYFSQIPQMKLPPEMMKLAQHIIRTKSAEFHPSMLEDHYRRALVGILRKKQAKRIAHATAIRPSQENVVNLMDALRRSIAAAPAAKPVAKRGRAKPSRHGVPHRARRAGESAFSFELGHFWHTDVELAVLSLVIAGNAPVRDDIPPACAVLSSNTQFGESLRSAPGDGSFQENARQRRKRW